MQGSFDSSDPLQTQLHLDCFCALEATTAPWIMSGRAQLIFSTSSDSSGTNSHTSYNLLPVFRHSYEIWPKQEDENKAMRALVTVRDLHRRKVWFDDRAANAICRACFHPSSRIMIAALSFLLDYEKIEQEGDSDESDDEEEAVHQSHVVVSKAAIYKVDER
ncbi:protein SDA1 [Tanacetum coccineum]